MKKIDWKVFIVCLAVPLVFVGGINGFLLMNIAAPIYNTLIQPPFSAPSWLFSVAWTILYALMGLASYCIWIEKGNEWRKKAIQNYVIQLALNFAWPLVFFRMELFGVAALIIVAMLFALGACIQSFAKVSNLASKLMIPVFIWVAYATYLNIAIALLN